MGYEMAKYLKSILNDALYVSYINLPLLIFATAIVLQEFVITFM